MYKVIHGLKPKIFDLTKEVTVMTVMTLEVRERNGKSIACQ
ncbi:hypothetical protein [Candidatus Nitrosocosmicus hydrocola]|nr:hypothetical protein [Candidatus Nitrosocosmicus hydrocola]